MEARKKIPEIRFKGYEGEWEEKKLGEISNTTIGEFVIRTKQNPNSQYPVYNGGISYTGFYDEYNNEGEKILISARGANAGFVNIIKKRYWSGNSCYSVDINDKLKNNTDFIFHFMKRNQNRFLDNQQAANIPSISKSDVEKFNLVVPLFEEQTQIGTYFQHLDSLISLHQRKYDKLLNVKKAMLEKMFPKEGADVPEIRFKGFEGKWEKKKLGEIATMKARIGWQGMKKSEFLEVGDYYLITGTDFANGFIDFSNCNYISFERYSQDINIQIMNDDVLITKDGTIGKVAYVKDIDKPATLNAGVFVIRGKENICNLFMYQYLAAPYLLDYADKQATGGTIKHLNQNVLVNFPLPFPCFEEQTQIGTFFQNLDTLITQHQKQLEKLKNIKKACLEKMFV